MNEAVDDAALAAEARRLNARYVQEVVLDWHLCPWAEKALSGGQVRQHVLLDDAPAPEAALPFVDELVAAPEIAIGLLIFPRVTMRAPAFDAFAERVRRADHARRPDAATSPPSPAFLIAAFHPGAPETFTTAPQLVRTSVLRRATGEGPKVSDEVTQRNFDAVRERGTAALEAVLRDIRRDRDESYARLAKE